MNIDSKLVGQLREKTGAPLMDCKRALQEANGDFEAAIDNLRKKGAKTADKLAGRATAEGRIRELVAEDARSGAMVMLSSQTDFVARNDDFSRLLDRIAAAAFAGKISSPAALLEQRLGSESVQDAIRQLTAKLGENVQLPQAVFFENPRGYVGGYVHHDQKIAGFASVTTNAGRDKAREFLKQLGMHITFAKPVALVREQIPADVIEREKAVYRDSDEVKSKPEDKRERIVEGKLQKFFSDRALIDQPWFKDDKTNVQKMLAKELGPDAKIESFVLFVVGA